MINKTQMAFFQHKIPITIRKNQETNKNINKKNLNLNFYHISSKVLDSQDILTHSLTKQKMINREISASNIDKIPNLSRSQEKRAIFKNLNNNNKFAISNMNYFQRNINNNLKKLSNFTNDNSSIIDNRKAKYYLKINNEHHVNNNQNSYSLPKIKIMKNPVQISLDKGEKEFKDKKANSQRNIFNYNNNNNIKSKIIYKLNQDNNLNDNYSEQISLESILNNNYAFYQPAKHSENSFDRIISYGVNTYKGLIRQYNEDRVTILINALINKKNIVRKNSKSIKISYFSIYDGHAGNKCCEFLKTYLHNYIFESEFFPLNPIKALEDGFKVCESKFMNLIYSDKKYIDSSGSCAIVILIINDICYIANLGDSRALYSCDDGKKFYQISRDHKPNDPIEKNRIYKAGGNIYKTKNKYIDNNIVNGYESMERLAKLPYRINPGRLAVSYL